MIYENKRRMEIIADVISEKLGVGVLVVEDGPAPAWYDGKNLHIARRPLNAMLKDMPDKDIKYLLYHEAAHALLSNLKPLDNLRDIIEPQQEESRYDESGRWTTPEKKIVMPAGKSLSKKGAEAILNLTQALEDIRIENGISKKYEGVKTELNRRIQDVIDGNKESFAKAFSKINPGSLGRAEIIKQRARNRYEEMVPKKIRDILDSKEIESITKKVNEAKDSWEVMELAQKMHFAAKKYYENQETQSGCMSHGAAGEKKNGKGEEQPGGGEGEGEGDGEGEHEGHGHGEGEDEKEGKGKGKGEGEGKGEGKGKGEGNDTEEGADQFRKNMFDKWDIKKNKICKGEATMLPEVPPVLDVHMDDKKSYEVLDEAKEGDKEFVVKEKDKHRYDRIREEISHTIKSLQRRVRDIFILKTKSHNESGYTSGKLIDQSRLYKVPLNYDRVFMKRTKEQNADYAITLLIDQSGSMSSDRKITEALKSAIVLSETLAELGIPFEVLGFTTDGGYMGRSHLSENLRKSYREIRIDHLRHMIYKQFEERFDEQVKERMGTITARCNNIDGESILWAYKRLSAHKAREKILIVLSDGQPAGSAVSAALGSFTANVIKAIEKKIKVIGIGYCTTTVKDYYKDHIIVEDTKELPATFCRLLNRVLNKGSVMHYSIGG